MRATAVNPDLEAFISHARERGMDHATIRMLLLSAGWKERDVARALTEQALDLPVPSPPDTGGAREAFLHLLAFAALYAWSIAAVVLLFDYVDRHLPDSADPEISLAAFRSGLRWSLATVIVAFPAFMLLMRLTIREIARSPEKARSGVRRWLTYLTLLVAAIALGGDLISLVFRLLEGDLTVRFLLKVALVFVVAGGAFAYYTLSVSGDGGAARRPWIHARFGLASTALCAVTVVWGFLLAGSPGAARLRKLDDRRVADLSAIRWEIESLCVTSSGSEGRPVLKRPLPGDLAELTRDARSRRPAVVDPSTGKEYGYEVVGPSRYALCATFDGARDEPDQPRWNHPPGRHCFELDALETD